MIISGWRKATIVVVLILGVAAVVAWAGWSRIAIALAPAKAAVQTRSAAALAADEQFWRTFHGAHYDAIQPALEALTTWAENNLPQGPPA